MTTLHLFNLGLVSKLNLNLSDNFQKVVDICKKYENDETYVYKNCVDITTSKSYIVVMQKQTDTETNENRNTMNVLYSKYRANKLKVVQIICLDDLTEETRITNNYSGILTKYETNKLVLPDGYDKNYEKICSSGIHYFKTIYPALFYGKNPSNYTGTWHSWYCNGNKESEDERKDGETNGKIARWYWDASEKHKGEIINGKKNGEWIFRGNPDSDYEMYSHEYYNMGKPVGFWTERSYEIGTKYRLYLGHLLGKNNEIDYPTMSFTKNGLIKTSLATTGLACLSMVLFRKYRKKII
jgi:hypothetical protein